MIHKAVTIPRKRITEAKKENSAKSLKSDGRHHRDFCELQAAKSLKSNGSVIIKTFVSYSKLSCPKWSFQLMLLMKSK